MKRHVMHGIGAITAALALVGCFDPGHPREAADAGAGQAICKDENIAWAYWDPDKAASFTSHGSTVVDNVTGLLWQRGGDDATATASEAQNYCDGLMLDGRDDWSLPKRIELASILDYEKPRPAIQSSFTGPGNVPWFWSSSPQKNKFDGISHPQLAVDVDSGLIDVVEQTKTYHARCVARPKPGASTQSCGPRYRRSPSGASVVDIHTGLEWEQPLGAPKTTLTWSDASDHCNKLSLPGGGGKWSVPTVRELLTLVDETQSGTLIDPTFFPSAPSDYFWTSTTSLVLDADQRDAAWSVSFYSGAAYHLEKDNSDLSASPGTRSVRCVRRASP